MLLRVSTVSAATDVHRWSQRFFGHQFVDNYCQSIAAKYDWERKLNARGVDAVALGPDDPVVSALKASRNWRLQADNGSVITFQHYPAHRSGEAGAGAPQVFTRSQQWEKSAWTVSAKPHCSLKYSFSRKEKLMNISALLAFWKEEDGQDLVEYSLLLAFIALAAVALLSSAQGTIKSLWTSVNTGLTSANTAATQAAPTSGS